ncbi:MAG: tandem-95 repeat protein [Tahibacter sp.]
MRIRNATWAVIALAFALLTATAASAQTYTYSIYVDGDVNSATGCNVPAMAGADVQLQADVTGGLSPQVVAVRRSTCSGGSFPVGTAIGGGYPVGLNNGTAGADVIELADALASLHLGGRAGLRLSVVAQSATGTDDLTTGPGGGPIIFGLPAIAVPFLTWPLLLLMLGALAFVGARRAKRVAAWRVIALFMAACGIAIAANFVTDGQVADWAGTPPLATDPAGDATSGESAIDITAFFAALENDRVFFRIDVRDLQNNPPVVNNASVTTLEDQPLVVSLTGSDVEGDTITFSVATTPTLGTVGAVTPTGTTSANVTYTPNANANGSDSFTFIGNDGQGSSAPGTIAITITPVNDAPLFTAGPSQAVAESAGAQSIAGWATGIAAGPADEAAQTVSFTTTVTGTTGNLAFTTAPAVSSTGTLTFTATNATSGIATVSVVATDNGGTANGGIDTSVAQTFSINVNAINHAPSFTAGVAQTVLEDAGAQTVNGWATAINDGDGNTQTLNFQIVSNSNPTLFSSAPTISPTGILTYTPAPNANGTASIGVALHDNGGTAFGGSDTSAPQTLSITVTAVNDAPSFTVGPNQSVFENAGAQTVNPWATAISPGPTDESAQTIAFAVTNNSNPALFGTAPAIAPNGALTYTPAPNVNGTATITLVANDSGGTANGGINASTAQTFTITVAGINHVPVFTISPTQTSLEDAGAQSAVAFATGISDGDGNTQTLTFQVTANSNPALFSVAPAISAAGVLTFTSAPNLNGVATISVVLKDNGGTANGGVDTSAPQSFTITVTAVNDVPSFTGGTSASVLESSGPQTFTNFNTAISRGPADESGQTLSFAVAVGATTGSLAFSAAPAISSTGTLTFTAQNGTFGTASVSATLSDNGGTANGGVDTSAAQVFTITVNNVNDPPVFTVGPPQTVLEDAGPQTVNAFLTGIADGDDGSQTITFSVSGNTNPALFSAGPAISAAGVLTYTTAANANGTATINITAQDNGGTANGGVDTSAPQSFTLTVTAVNDVPSFTSGTSASVLESSGPHTFANFNTTISPGPADESGQTLSFAVAVGATTGSLAFSAAPAISSTGTLTFTAQNGTFGTASVSATLSDNGGTANGGVDTSAAQVFTITVNNVNDPPVFTVGPPQTVLEDAGPQTVNAFLTGIADGDDGSQTITFSVSGNTNPALFSAGPAISAAGVLTYTTAANANGTATINITAQDNGGTANGGVDTSAPQAFSITVTAVNDAPGFTAGTNPVVPEDSGPASITSWATAIVAGPPDESAQTLAFTANVTAGAALFATPPAISPTGTLTFTPAANASGVATVSVTLQDNGGVANAGVDTSPVQVLTITISSVDDAPVAVADAATVAEDSGANAVNVLANDTDIDGGPKSIGSVTQPANGVVVITGGGTGLTYAPNANYCNTPPGTTLDTFTYTLTPGGSSTTVTMSVTCVDDAPIAVNDAATVAEDSGASAVNVLVNDTDVDGGPKSIISVTQPANGVVVITGGGTGLTYAPNANYCNTPPGTALDTFTYTLTPGGSSATVSMSVTCVNDAPVNSVPGVQTLGIGSTRTFNAANANLISTADIDAVAGTINLLVAVPTPADGSINLANTGGLLSITGQGTNSVSATGTLAAINASLDGMTYTAPGVVPTPNPVLLGVTVNDNGNTGTGGPLSDTDIIPIAIDNAPFVTSSTPANASVQANNVAISVNFSESVNATAGSVTLTCGGPNLITGGTAGAGVITLTPTHSVLPNGASCTLTVLAANVTDVDAIDPPDNMAANYVANFTVDAAPAVTTTVPANAAVAANNTTITLNFTEPVNLTATAFTLNCGAAVTVTGLPASNVSSVVLTPTTALPDGATCNATVVAAQVSDADAIDPPDNMAANFTFSFTTDAAPTVTAFTPANGSVTNTGPTLNVTFSENVDLTAGAFTLLCNATPVAFSSVPALPAAGTTTLAVTPLAPLAAGASCIATVVAAQVSDSDAIDPPQNLAADVTRSFTVDSAPTVLSTAPSNGATNVVPSSSITVTFSEPVNFDTTANAANTSFDLECPSGTPANFVVVTASPATVVVLNPDDNAVAGQTCVLTILSAGITDSDALDPPNNMPANFVASIGFGSLANDDAYNVTPHLTLSSAAGAAELDANDVLGAGVITSFGFGACTGTAAGSQLDAGAANGRLTITASGAFSYEPPASVANTTKTFCYTVTGGDTANIVFTLQNNELVWFVDAAAAAGGVGNQARPFQTLAAAAAVDTTNDTIYVASNGSNYTAGITLEAGERLIGDGSGSTLAAISGVTPVAASSFPAFSGTAPTFTCAADCVTLAGAGVGNNTLRGFTVANSATDVAGTNFGTLTVAEVTLNGTGRTLNLDTGVLAGNLLSATSTSSATQGMLLQSVSGNLNLGNTTIAASALQGILISATTANLNFGTTTVSAGTDGISVQNGTSGTRTFVSADITTTAGIGLLLNGAGNLTIISGIINTTNRAAIDATGANALNVALTSATSTNSTGKGINLDGATTGSLVINGGSISGSTNEAFDLNLGSAAITYAGTISKTSAGRLVEVTNRTAGTVLLSGNLSSTGTSTGINIGTNTGGTINFTGSTKTLTTGASNAVTLATNGGTSINFTGGGLVINTTSGQGFAATGGATGVTVQGTGNTIVSTTGIALNFVSTTIGAVGAAPDSGLRFQSISAGTGASGPTNGIVLNTTGALGALTVTGTGVTAGSGGTIQRTASNGVLAISTNNLTLSNMNLPNNAQSQTVPGSSTSCGGDLRAGNNLSCVAALNLQTVSNATLTNMSVTGSGQVGINGNGVSALVISGSTITGNGNEGFENGLTLQNLSGTSSITNTIIRDNAARQLHVGNIVNSSLTLTITGTRTNNAYPTQDTSTTMIGNTAPSGANTQQGILFESFGAAAVNMALNLNGVVLNNNFPANAVDIQTLTGGTLGGTTQNTSFDVNAGGVILSMQNAAGGTYDVTSNEFNRTNLQSILYAAANPTSGTLQGTISGNTIGTAGQSGSACQPTTGSNCHGIDINFIGGSGRIATRVQNNVVQQFDGAALSVRGNGAGVLDLNAVSNTFQNPLGLIAHGIETSIGTTAGANVLGCLNLNSNTITGTYEDPGVGTQFGIVTNVRFNATHKLPGYAGAANVPASAATFISTSNPGAGAKVFSQYSAPAPGYTGGGACTTP